MVIARAPLHVSNSASLVAHTTNPPRLAPAYARLALLARLALIVLFDVGAAAAGALGVDLVGHELVVGEGPPAAELITIS